MQAFFNDTHVFFRAIFVNIFMSPVMLVLAIAVMLEWHIRKTFTHAEFMQTLRTWLGRPSTHMRRLALNILILQIYFDPDMPLFIQRRKFTCSVMAVVVETIVIRHGSRLLARRHRQGQEEEGKDEELPLRRRLLSVDLEEPEADLDPRWDDDPDAEPAADLTESMYMDLTVAFHSIVPIFIVQLALMAFYMNELNDPNSDTKDEKNVQFGYWVVGVMIQLYAGEQQLGSPYNSKFWKQVLLADEQNPIRRVSEQTLKVYDRIPLTYRTVWEMRSWMDFIINSVARDMLMYTFPIMLCVEGPLDFVKDCCAVFFITTLDDTGFEKAKSVPQMMVRLKFNIFFDHLKATTGQDCDIPLRFTKDEAESAKFDPMVWDQFEKQREYVSPYLQQTKLLDYMMDNIQEE